MQSATDKNVGTTDCISRRAAIDALKKDMASLDHIIKGMSANDVRLDAYVSQRNQVNYDIYTINNLPPAQPEPNYDEWCTDCKEYDHENSCCPRWTKVIRQTRRELQDEFVMTAVDGTLWVTVDDVQKVGRVIVDEDKSKFCRQFYLEEEQRTGKWIPQDHNKRVGNISTCVYYYPICSKCGKVGIETYKFCPHCGAKMTEGDAE